MKSASGEKRVRRIKVNLDRCNGCRACEIACSTYHALPKYSNVNPSRSRIRVVMNPFNDEYVPTRSTDYSKAECDGRRVYTINDKEYSECSFCGSICPVRDLFKDPASGIPLKCDLCEEDPPPEEPLCVQACPLDALTYEELEEEVEEEARRDEIETGLRSLIDKYGFDKIADTFARMSQTD